MRLLLGGIFALFWLTAVLYAMAFLLSLAMAVVMAWCVWMLLRGVFVIVSKL